MALQTKLVLATLTMNLLMWVYILCMSWQTSCIMPLQTVSIQRGSRWVQTHLSRSPSYTSLFCFSFYFLSFQTSFKNDLQHMKLCHITAKVFTFLYTIFVQQLCFYMEILNIFSRPVWAPSDISVIVQLLQSYLTILLLWSENVAKRLKVDVCFGIIWNRCYVLWHKDHEWSYTLVGQVSSHVVHRETRTPWWPSWCEEDDRW